MTLSVPDKITGDYVNGNAAIRTSDVTQSVNNAATDWESYSREDKYSFKRPHNAERQITDNEHDELAMSGTCTRNMDNFIYANQLVLLNLNRQCVEGKSLDFMMTAKHSSLVHPFYTSTITEQNDGEQIVQSSDMLDSDGFPLARKTSEVGNEANGSHNAVVGYNAKFKSPHCKTSMYGNTFRDPVRSAHGTANGLDSDNLTAILGSERGSTKHPAQRECDVIMASLHFPDHDTSADTCGSYDSHTLSHKAGSTCHKHHNQENKHNTDDAVVCAAARRTVTNDDTTSLMRTQTNKSHVTLYKQHSDDPSNTCFHDSYKSPLTDARHTAGKGKDWSDQVYEDAVLIDNNSYYNYDDSNSNHSPTNTADVNNTNSSNNALSLLARVSPLDVPHSHHDNHDDTNHTDSIQNSPGSSKINIYNANKITGHSNNAVCSEMDAYDPSNAAELAGDVGSCEGGVTAHSPTSLSASAMLAQSQTNLFVRNLPGSTDDDALRHMFEPFGHIVALAIMRNIQTGMSLGTAFVRFRTHKEALAALHGFTSRRRVAGGRPITVQWARKEHDRAPAGEARRRMKKLFVRNIPRQVTSEMLSELFRVFGPVQLVSLHRDTIARVVPAVHDERRIAFITYAMEGVAEKAAAAVHNTRPFAECQGIPLMVKLAEDVPLRHQPAVRGQQDRRTGEVRNGAGASSAPSAAMYRSIRSSSMHNGNCTRKGKTRNVPHHGSPVSSASMKTSMFRSEDRGAAVLYAVRDECGGGLAEGHDSAYTEQQTTQSRSAQQQLQLHNDRSRTESAVPASDKCDFGSPRSQPHLAASLLHTQRMTGFAPARRELALSAPTQVSTDQLTAAAAVGSGCGGDGLYAAHSSNVVSGLTSVMRLNPPLLQASHSYSSDPAYIHEHLPQAPQQKQTHILQQQQQRRVGGYVGTQEDAQRNTVYGSTSYARSPATWPQGNKDGSWMSSIAGSAGPVVVHTSSPNNSMMCSSSSMTCTSPHGEWTSSSVNGFYPVSSGGDNSVRSSDATGVMLHKTQQSSLNSSCAPPWGGDQARQDVPWYHHPEEVNVRVRFHNNSSSSSNTITINNPNMMTASRAVPGALEGCPTAYNGSAMYHDNNHLRHSHPQVGVHTAHDLHAHRTHNLATDGLFSLTTSTLLKTYPPANISTLGNLGRIDGLATWKDHTNHGLHSFSNNHVSHGPTLAHAPRVLYSSADCRVNSFQAVPCATDAFAHSFSTNTWAASPASSSPLTSATAAVRYTGKEAGLGGTLGGLLTRGLDVAGDAHIRVCPPQQNDKSNHSSNNNYYAAAAIHTDIGLEGNIASPSSSLMSPVNAIKREIVNESVWGCQEESLWLLSGNNKSAVSHMASGRDEHEHVGMLLSCGAQSFTNSTHAGAGGGGCMSQSSPRYTDRTATRNASSGTRCDMFDRVAAGLRNLADGSHTRADSIIHESGSGVALTSVGGGTRKNGLTRRAADNTLMRSMDSFIISYSAHTSSSSSSSSTAPDEVMQDSYDACVADASPLAGTTHSQQSAINRLLLSSHASHHALDNDVSTQQQLPPHAHVWHEATRTVTDADMPVTQRTLRMPCHASQFQHSRITIARDAPYLDNSGAALSPRSVSRTAADDDRGVLEREPRNKFVQKCTERNRSAAAALVTREYTEIQNNDAIRDEQNVRDRSNKDHVNTDNTDGNVTAATPMGQLHFAECAVVNARSTSVNKSENGLGGTLICNSSVASSACEDVQSSTSPLELNSASRPVGDAENRRHLTMLSTSPAITTANLDNLLSAFGPPDSLDENVPLTSLTMNQGGENAALTETSHTNNGTRKESRDYIAFGDQDPPVRVVSLAGSDQFRTRSPEAYLGPVPHS